jgi:hypothetical protein
MTSLEPGAAETCQVDVSWCCVLLTAFTWLTSFLRAWQLPGSGKVSRARKFE